MISEQPFCFAGRGQAIPLQREMATQVINYDDPIFERRFLCGMDVAYVADIAFVSAVLWDIEQDRVLERVNSIDHVSVPYFSGLLGFREGPLLLRIAQKLKTAPDVFMVNGQGVAHPRRCGLACQFGLATGKPTVGVAKSLLYGRLENGKVVDPDGSEIGRVVITPQGRKFYVRIGHRISLDTATRLVEKCLQEGHPAPLRQAHLDSVELKGSKSS